MPINIHQKDPGRIELKDFQTALKSLKELKRALKRALKRVLKRALKKRELMRGLCCSDIKFKPWKILRKDN